VPVPSDSVVAVGPHPQNVRYGFSSHGSRLDRLATRLFTLSKAQPPPALAGGNHALARMVIQRHHTPH